MLHMTGLQPSLYRYKIHPFNHIPLHLPLLQHQWRSVGRRSLGSESLDFVATRLHWSCSNDRGRRVWERGVDAVAKCQPYEGRSALGIRFYHTKDAVHSGLGFTVVVGAKLRSLELGSAPGSGPCLGESVGEPSLVIIVLEKCFTLDCSRSRGRCKMLEAKMSPPFTSI